MRRKNVIEGLVLLDNQGGQKEYSIYAEHDVIYGGEFIEKTPLSFCRKMYKLGWFLDADTNSWVAFV